MSHRKSHHPATATRLPAHPSRLPSLRSDKNHLYPPSTRPSFFKLPFFLLFFLLFLLLVHTLYTTQLSPAFSTNDLHHTRLHNPPAPALPVHILTLPTTTSTSTTQPLQFQHTALPNATHLLSSPQQLPGLLSSLPHTSYVLLTHPCIRLHPSALEQLFLHAYFHNQHLVIPRHVHLNYSHESPTSDPTPWQNRTDPTLLHLLPLLIRVDHANQHLLKDLRNSTATPFITVHTHLVRVVDTAVVYTTPSSARSPSSCHPPAFIPLHLVQPTKRDPHGSPASLIRHSAHHRGEEMYPPAEEVLPDVNALRSLSERQYAADGVSAAPSFRRRMLFAMPWAQMGGSELAMLHLMQHVRTSHGWDVSVVLFQPSFGQDSHGNLELKHDWMQRLYDFTYDVVDVVALAPFHRAAELLRYVLETRRPDVLLFTNGRWVYQQLALVRFIMPQMVVADYNHMVYKYWNGGGNPRYGTNHTEFIDYHFTASNNVTEAMRTWVAERGFDKSKVSTCYIGTDISRVLMGRKRRKARDEVRLRLGINPHSTLVLFAGRFVMEKGLDVLVAAAKRLVPKKPQVSFLIVGDGDSAHLLDDISQPARVVVHPPVYDEDMPRLYAAADILLLPSVNEGIALVLYEAMAAGLVVVATDVGGQSELVTPGRGVLIKPGSAEEVTDRVVRAISGIIDHPERYAGMRKTARRDMQRFFNIHKFRKCVINGIVKHQSSNEYNPDAISTPLLGTVREALLEERRHGTWALRTYPLQLDRVLSVAYIGSLCALNSSGNSELCASIQQEQRGVSTFTQFRQRYPTVQMLVFSSFGSKSNASADPNIDIIEASSEKAGGCSVAPLIQQTVLASDTELIAFGDESVLENGPDLQELANKMRADQWDVFGLVRSAPDGIMMPNNTVERIRWHDRNRDMVRTCVVSKSEMDEWYKADVDGPSQAPIDASIAPYLMMARTEALKTYLQNFPEADFDTTQMFVGFWKTGLKIGLAPGRILLSKIAKEGVRDCQRTKGLSWGKGNVFEIMPDKEECAEGLKAVRYWPKQ